MLVGSMGKERFLRLECDLEGQVRKVNLKLCSRRESWEGNLELEAEVCIVPWHLHLWGGGEWGLCVGSSHGTGADRAQNTES